MKKLFSALTIVVIGFMIFTGQKSVDSPVWNTPVTTAWDVSLPYSPFLPLDRNISVKQGLYYMYSPSGVFAVAPSFRPYPTTATQSEIHAYIHPMLQGTIFAGWNSYGPSFYGTGYGVTSNSGVNWTGNNTMPGLATNSGDPSVAVYPDGKIFMNAIGGTASQQLITWSTNYGVSWSPYVLAGQNQSGSTADKNHLGIDDKSTSPYYGSLYIGWTDFSISSYPAKITRSTNGGVNWTSQQVTVPLSGHFSQGINIHTGPNGEVYFVCATNILSSPYTEDYIGFGKSTNGGVNWTVNESAINVNGIRGNLKSSSIRVNSFPWMAVDKTGGTYNGHIYVTWAQKNLAPAGTDPDICFAKSTNGGTNWSTPVRVNNDPMNNGRDQWFSNICVDAYGGINIVFYDSRNPTTNDSAEVYVGRSIDGGTTWENIKVSDHRFRPVPISGLAGGYQGDYIGIATGNNKVWPFWADNYSGVYQTWTAPIDLGPSINHTQLSNTEQTSGPRAVNATIIPAGSNIDPTKTKLYFTKTTNFTDSVLMTNSSGNNWTANINLTGSGTYKYYIKTADLLGRIATSPAGAPATYHSFIATPDTIKPVITHTALGNTPKVNWPATVSAVVTDNIGIDSVWVKWYKNNTSTGIKHKKLLNTGGDNFSGAFNSDTSQVSIGDIIYYKVFAQDAGSNHRKDSTAQYSFSIINQATITIGTGTTPVGWPYYTFYMDSRTQMLYLGSEINIPSGGYIANISFDVTTAASQVMNGFKVKMKNTTASTISTYDNTNMTTAYDGTYTVPGTGWQTVNLQTPFYYVGGQNLIVEICFNNSSYTSNTSVNASVVTGRNLHQHSDLSSGDGCTAITTVGSTYTQLPNIKITINPGPNNASQIGNVIPETYSLTQNYPNPFNPTTKINFAIPKQGFVTMKVYDVLGRVVRNLVNEVKDAGLYSVDFNASELSSGVYFYKMEVNGFSDVKRMVLVK